MLPFGFQCHLPYELEIRKHYNTHTLTFKLGGYDNNYKKWEIQKLVCI